MFVAAKMLKGNSSVVKSIPALSMLRASVLFWLVARRIELFQKVRPSPMAKPRNIGSGKKPVNKGMLKNPSESKEPKDARIMSLRLLRSEKTNPANEKPIARWSNKMLGLSSPL